MRTTIEQFIKDHNLDVDIKDSAATKLIAAKLRSSGYKRLKVYVEGKQVVVWDKGRDEKMEKLKSKLASLKL